VVQQSRLPIQRRRVPRCDSGARYEHADRRRKQALLDEIVAVTGMHRKAVTACCVPCGNTAPEGAVGVEMLWLASGRIGAHRLRPFVRE